MNAYQLWKPRKAFIVVMLFLLLSNGCSTAHLKNQDHTWFPGISWAHKNIQQCWGRDNGTCAEFYGLSMVFLAVTDTISLPVHAMGHLFSTRPITYRPDKIQIGMLNVTGGGLNSTPFELAFTARFLDQKDEPIVGSPIKIALANLGSQDSWADIKELVTDQHGTAGVRLASDVKMRRSITSLDNLTLEFPGDWKSDLAKKGEAVETSPARIPMFLRCKKGSCLVEAEDHQPLKDFTFRVKRIEHIDQAQKTAYAKQLQDEEREAHAAAQRQLEKDLAEAKLQQAETQRQQEENAKEARRLEHLRQNRDKAHFKSFEDAQKALASLIDGDYAPGGSLFLSLVQNPMSLKGRVIVARVKIVQAIDPGQLLMTNFPSVFTMYPGSDMLHDGIYMGFVTPYYEGDKEFVDDQIVDIVGEITGTTQYTTRMQSVKTVPNIRIYGIRASGND